MVVNFYKKASLMGFEPTVSTLTGWRALLAAPQGHVLSVAQVGLEPTASLVLSQRGLPIAYRAVFVVVFVSGAQSRSRTCNRLGLGQAAQPIGVPGHDPGWTRTIVAWL